MITSRQLNPQVEYTSVDNIYSCISLFIFNPSEEKYTVHSSYLLPTLIGIKEQKLYDREKKLMELVSPLKFMGIIYSP